LRVRLHFTAKNFIHVRLAFLPSPPKPSEDLGIHAKAHQLLDGPIKAADLDVG
jgi:hypothetical protein